jgi:hypothetical protein
LLHTWLPAASSADTTGGGPKNVGYPEYGPSGVSLALIRSPTPHLGGGAKRRQFESHPSDLAGRNGPAQGSACGQRARPLLIPPNVIRGSGRWSMALWSRPPFRVSSRRDCWGRCILSRNRTTRWPRSWESPPVVLGWAPAAGHRWWAVLRWQRLDYGHHLLAQRAQPSHSASRSASRRRSNSSAGSQGHTPVCGAPAGL